MTRIIAGHVACVPTCIPITCGIAGIDACVPVARIWACTLSRFKTGVACIDTWDVSKGSAQHVYLCVTMQCESFFSDIFVVDNPCCHLLFWFILTKLYKSLGIMNYGL